MKKRKCEIIYRNGKKCNRVNREDLNDLILKNIDVNVLSDLICKYVGYKIETSYKNRIIEMQYESFKMMKKSCCRFLWIYENLHNNTKENSLSYNLIHDTYGQYSLGHSNIITLYLEEIIRIHRALTDINANDETNVIVIRDTYSEYKIFGKGNIKNKYFEDDYINSNLGGDLDIFRIKNDRKVMIITRAYNNYFGLQIHKDKLNDLIHFLWTIEHMSEDIY